MNFTAILLLLVPVSVIIWGIYLAYKYTHPRKLSKQKAVFFLGAYKKITKNNSFKTQIIDFDKLYHKILLGIGHKGTFGEILKDEPREIGDINNIWKLHKIRNKLVHDFDAYEESFLKRKASEYERETSMLLRAVS